MRHHHFFYRVQIQSGCMLALLRLWFALIDHHISRCIVSLLLIARGCFCLSSVLLCRNKFWESIDGSLGFLGTKSCFMTIYAIFSRFSSFFSSSRGFELTKCAYKLSRKISGSCYLASSGILEISNNFCCANSSGLRTVLNFFFLSFLILFIL